MDLRYNFNLNTDKKYNLNCFLSLNNLFDI